MTFHKIEHSCTRTYDILLSKAARQRIKLLQLILKTGERLHPST